MMTALLILAAVALVAALIGVCCQIAGGGFFAVFHIVNGSVGSLLGLLGESVVAIADGFRS